MTLSHNNSLSHEVHEKLKHQPQLPNSLFFSYLICSLFVLILYFVFNRENDPPNKEVSQQLIKEVQEVEQIKNDSLCTERRILG